jgi:oligopeptide/dipeptide ABC transporter ATP-binding protein
MNPAYPLLSVNNLKTYFFTSSGITKAADEVSFSLQAGETIGVVGESGSGKTVTALSILKLIPEPQGKIVGGEILFEGLDLLKMPNRNMRSIRGNKISMIFQEPMTSLNPVFTIGNQVSESISLHQGLNRRDALDKCIEMLKLVRIPSPEKRVHDYPYQLSGGMRQRAMIAMALSCDPKILIADEPTTALDVTIQAQILDLMDRLKGELNTAIIMITHNLSIVAEMSKEVVVMYAGKIVEKGPVDNIFYHSQHPYTKGLLKTIPRIDRNIRSLKQLPEIPGVIPSLDHLPKGCYFHPRCPYAKEICRQEAPELKEIADQHFYRCWLVHQ